MKQAALLLAAFATVVFFLAAGLRPDAFFVGDPGVKLIAARTALANPTHPFNVPLTVVGSERILNVEPFFEVHGDHAHAIVTELFPLVTAPLIKLFGIRGAYVLPALGFLGFLAACGSLAVMLDRKRPATLVIVIAGLGTPFLFYGLEFWEHAPAVALGTAAAALIVGRPAGRVAFAAGLLFGIASLLRPETMCFLAATILASRWLEAPPDWRSLGLVVLGTLVALAPLELYTIVHQGTLLPAHGASQVGPLLTGWGPERVRLAVGWLMPSGWTFSGPVNIASFWSVAPAAILAFVPVRATTARRGRTFLWILAGVDALLVVLTAPNDGGGQWGPRYLLFAYAPLVVLAADAIDQLPRRNLAVGIALVVLLAGCIWIQRAAYLQLRGTKLLYGRVVDFVATEVPAGGYVVTDLWWLDQVAASATSARRLVYVPDTAGGHAFMHRLSEAVVPIVTVLRSESESPDVTPWTEGTCYVEIQRHSVAVRGLVAILLHHRCAS